MAERDPAKPPGARGTWASARTPAAWGGPERPALSQKLLALVQGAPLLNGVVLLGITVGFFQGWLKLHYPHPAITFLFDAVLLLALGLVYLRQKPGTRFLPRSPVGRALVTFYVICVVYAALPLGPPWLVSLAALRGWCFASLMYALGFHMTRSPRQVKGYFYVLILLGVLTAAYGLRQSPEEINRRMQEDPLFAQRLKGTYYDTESGKVQLRVFSTFVTSGVFGSVMSYVMILALVLLGDKDVSKYERLLLMAAMAPMAYGLVLSGARTALVMLAVGFGVIAWHQRRLPVLILLPLLVYLAVRWSVGYTHGASLERYGTLLETGTVWGRFQIPVINAWDDLIHHPLGGGLGKSGYSVPFILTGRTGYAEFERGEGDLSCLTIEMGVVGLVFFVRLLWVTLDLAYHALQRLRDTPVATVALASAAWIVLALVSFPIGSPFLSIPTGALTWFFVGTLEKLAEAPLMPAGAPAGPVEAGVASGKRFLSWRPPRPAARTPGLPHRQ